VVAELPQPALRVLERDAPGHVVDHQRAHRAAVVGARDGAVAGGGSKEDHQIKLVSAVRGAGKRNARKKVAAGLKM
jgi:hypothetical protein